MSEMLLNAMIAVGVSLPVFGICCGVKKICKSILGGNGRMGKR